MSAASCDVLCMSEDERLQSNHSNLKVCMPGGLVYVQMCTGLSDSMLHGVDSSSCEVGPDPRGF